MMHLGNGDMENSNVPLFMRHPVSFQTCVF